MAVISSIVSRTALLLAAAAPPSARRSTPLSLVTPRRTASAPELPKTVDPVDDPIFRDELWLDSGHVRYADGLHGAGVGYCASFSINTRAGNHSRAILILDAAPRPDEEALCALAGKVALSCECVALVPLLRGGAAQWPAERLASEAWAATSYLNGAFGAETLAIVAVGATASTTLALLSAGALDAHACIALCPSGDPASAARAAHELPVPLLALCAGDADGIAHATTLRESLSLNSRLRSDFYVNGFEGRSAAFVLGPQDAADAKAAERALALLQGWVDRYCPERLSRRQTAREIDDDDQA